MDNMQNDGFGNSAVQSGSNIVDAMMSSEQPVLNTEGQVNSPVDAQVPNVGDPMEIDPRFSNLNPQEAMLRTFQSRYDQAQTELQKYKAEVERAKLVEDILVSLNEDDEALEAFLYQRKPELVKKPDFNSWAQSKLKAEFGEEFEFDRDKVGYDPSHIAYQKRVEQLYTEYQQGNQTKVKNLAELRERREQERKVQEEALRNEYLKLQETHKLSNEQMRGFVNFISKANTDLNLLFNLWRLSNRQPQIPNTPQGSYQQANSGSNIDMALRMYGF